jgi:hypothetical protein
MPARRRSRLRTRRNFSGLRSDTPNITDNLPPWLNPNGIPPWSPGWPDSERATRVPDIFKPSISQCLSRRPVAPKSNEGGSWTRAEARCLSRQSPRPPKAWRRRIGDGGSVASILPSKRSKIVPGPFLGNAASPLLCDLCVLCGYDLVYLLRFLLLIISKPLNWILLSFLCETAIFLK